MNLHRKTGVRFMIAYHVNPAMPHSEHVHLSRSIQDDEGNHIAVVDAILDIDSLLPVVADPCFRDSIEMNILNQDLETVLLRNFSVKGAGSGKWMIGMVNPGEETIIRGRFHVLVGD